MSAFMVNKEHIDMLVALAYYGPAGASVGWERPYFQNRVLGYEQLDDLGEMLVKENLSSIHARYPDTITEPEGTPGPIEQYWLQPYKFTDHNLLMTPVQGFCALSCYEYQSCEHDEWERSSAHEFIERLRRSIIHSLPGFNEAPWQWTDEAIAKHRTIARIRRRA